MNNKEKYKNELIEVIKKDGRLCEFVKKHEVFRMFGKDSTSYCKMTCVTCGAALDLWLDEEYQEPEVDWGKVPVDTLVRVRDREDDPWKIQYFKGFDEVNNPVFKYSVWDNGRTSRTAAGLSMRWKYCELVEDEDNDK